MKSSLPDLPILKSLPLRMEAVHYNNVYLALHRLGEPLCLMLPGMRGFEVQLNHEAWVCFDRASDNHPLLAWTGFRGNARSGLYEPVPCRLLMYHPYASLLMRNLPEEISRLLIRRLSQRRVSTRAQVHPF
ncbi:MAG: hypothetical protein Kow0096_25880 [Thiohalomonadaceae bacterium]